MKKIFTAVIFLASSLLILFAPIALADIYKWVDSNGETHVSNNKEDATQSNVSIMKESAARPHPKSAAEWKKQREAIEKEVMSHGAPTHN